MTGRRQRLRTLF